MTESQTEPLADFHPITRTWFEHAFSSPTDVQARGWPVLRRGENALLLAPTGSGKTLAAFLASLDKLAFHDKTSNDVEEDAYEKGIRVLYISPLKALAVDIERNLRAPLNGIAHFSKKNDVTCRIPRIDIRTGDTPSSARQKQKRNPAEILVTTPESLFLILTSGASENLRTVHTVILDEIHVLAGSKRGVHLSISLERLEEICTTSPQRIGLSATQKPLERIAHFLGGNEVSVDKEGKPSSQRRPVHIIDASAAPKLELSLVVPVENMDRPPRPVEIDGFETLPQPSLAARPRSAEERRKQKSRPSTSKTIPASSRGETRVNGSSAPQGGGESGIWPSVYPILLAEIRAHRSTLIFVNSRLLCERLTQKLNDHAGQEIVLSHHGSVSHEKRAIVEERLKEGSIPCIVATSSLELGIDMGAIDRVILVESPGAASTGLQRVGRAGHSVGETSRALLIPKFKGDLFETAVVAQLMLQASIEATQPPQNALDVLAQQIAAMISMHAMTGDEIFEVVLRSASYSTLTRPLLESVLDMLSGRYPSDAFAQLPPRCNWDRTTDLLTARRGTRMTAVLNAGTIPDRGLYRVHLANEQGPRLGELDEEMVFETRQGDTLILGASTWRVEEIQQDKVLVSPAPGEPGRLPFWRGESLSRPLEVGRAMAAFLSKFAAAENETTKKKLIADQAPMNDYAQRNLFSYLDAQEEATGALPSMTTIVVERFIDELGDWRICVLTPFGAKLHAPWALVMEHIFAKRTGLDVKVMYSNDGIALQLTDAGEENLETELFFPSADEVEEILVEQLQHSALFAARFRENAGRALLLPKKSFKGRRPLWLQRKKAANLLASALQYPQFPIVLETYRECLQDVFDLPALKELLQDVSQKNIRVVDVHTKRPSPFARSLVYQYTASYLYDYDAPLAERRAAALSLDRNLLMELLGREGLRNLLDNEAIEEVEMQLQRLHPEFPPSTDDDIHDLLRVLGDLTTNELEQRGVLHVEEQLSPLIANRRVIRIRLQKETRYIAVEDAARYRDAFAIVLPSGLPNVFLEEPDAPVTSLLHRFARKHGPFTADEVAQRFEMVPAQAKEILQTLVEKGELEEGELRPGGIGNEYCDPDVLRRIRKRTLFKLRDEVAPVEGQSYARFLLDWHGIQKTHDLDEALEPLFGAIVSYAVLVEEILPARIKGFRAADLDMKGASGEVVWMGVSRLGAKDGKLILAPREDAPLYLPAAVLTETEKEDWSQETDDEEALAKDLLDEDALSILALRILRILVQRGALFFFELRPALEEDRYEAPAHDDKAALFLEDELENALWELVWRGFVTNDTFAALTVLRGKTRKTARGKGTRRGQKTALANGRWSLTAPFRTEIESTRRRHAQANQLLQAYGVVARETVRAAGVPGGFASLYPIFREMEDAGKVRRGRFISGLDGAQFALPGVVDRLRATRTEENADADDVKNVVVLSSCDLANPYGATLPWPPHPCARARRSTGSKIVLVNGRLVLYLEKGLKTMLTFVSDDEERLLARAVSGLRTNIKSQSLNIKRVDGEVAARSHCASALLRAGFEKDIERLRLSTL
ncbi:MAG: DEAD/DEAH box helicase [Deltaproteobacteria bacterium]|nr:DEAD/DEAH box helicase [Deltaproteobacteria bacterium]